MKARLLWKGTMAVLIFSLTLVACNKEDDPSGPGELQTLAFDGEVVLDKLPSGLTNSADQYAKECVNMIESALDMSGFIDNMTVPDNAVRSAKKASSDTWTWTWTDGAHSYTIYWTYSEDNNKHYWTQEIQIDDGPRHSFIDAWEYQDNTGGEVIYNFNWTLAVDETSDYEDLFVTYRWSLDTNGDYIFSMTYDSSEAEYDYYLRYEVVVRDDGSGTIDYWLSDMHFYHMEWTASGAGSWIYYLGDDQTLSGNWDAA